MQRVQKSRFSAISLFSGVGGLDFGFVEAGVRILFATDTNRSAAATFSQNSDVVVKAIDIGGLNIEDLPRADIIIAGPPCQGFSTIGKRQHNDRRNDLLHKTAVIIAKFRPSTFVIENVMGLEYILGGAILERTLRTLRSAGLFVDLVRIDCARLGLAQTRRRLLIVGGVGRRGVLAALEVKRAALQERPRASVGQVLRRSYRGVRNHDPILSLAPGHRNIITAIGPGQKLCDTRNAITSVHSWDLPKVFGRVDREGRELLEALLLLRRRRTGRRYRHLGDGRAVTTDQIGRCLGWSTSKLEKTVDALCRTGYVTRPHGQYVDLIRKFNGRFRRLDPDGLAPAVTRDFSSPRSVVHPRYDRALTVRECARLQGFPDSFIFHGSKGEQFQQVANAFPPPISRIIADAICRALSAPLT